MINSVLSSNGQSFQPAEADDVFSKAGLSGRLSDVEYRANQYMPMVSVDAALVTALKTATSVVYAADARTGHEHDATLTFTGVANQIVPKGYVLWIKGCYAADICGDKTSALKAFIAYADGTSDGTDSVMYIREVNFSGEGTKEVTDKDGAALTVSTLNALVNTNDKVKAAIDFLPAGDYFGGFVRIDGAMEFETVDQLDASNADTKKETVEGLTVIENRAVDVIKGTNDTRWTVVSMSGIVEPREVAYVLVKDAVINIVTTNP